MSVAPIGVLGGTCDPVHFGHLRLAQEVGELVRLAEVRFIPSGTPPHRAAPHVMPQQRLQMGRLPPPPPAPPRTAALRRVFPPEWWPARMPQPLAREYEARLLKQPLAVHLSPAGGVATQ